MSPSMTKSPTPICVAASVSKNRSPVEVVELDVDSRADNMWRYGRWIASVSLLWWPWASTYVLSNHFEIVYDWELRTWWRSSPLSLATHRMINTRTNRLAKHRISPTSDVGRALNTTFDFRQFLRLPPREVRDNMQVQAEALDTLHRTKILVITVTSVEGDFSDLVQKWSLDMLHFRRIRVDLIMTDITAAAVRMCLCRVASLLKKRVLSLQTLEVRIGYSHMNASAAVRDHGFALLFRRKDIAESMCELAPLLRRQQRRERRGYKPLQVWWGVSEVQKKAGDYSCACTYLRVSYLQRIWGQVCPKCGTDDGSAVPVSADEDCRHLGFKLHQCW
ncbi:hypothetical protein A1F94_013201 [Pyrenophora tritici-repentis]|uniref:Uncharacterized protein n=1 Tax=Pyrenophora tritici-repentis TaxID=45151 RepID=A0A2W1CXY8_9PLEO|nr:hypothetical protein PtrV1_05223 [Pyrenophora tritici-repentis]KAF7572531.1 hypothetical protein PtrM4_074360 [Pyrenophora tritici-repentis]KAG9375935.1 hypothetical protein A1F94_013201 [Pyrenophora tritici-repentis]PZC89470.1 hypothetical protein A1F95_10268 [Pyrenophora tritici-repentis]PZD23269.1 hypothetical protein A1F96_10401 [Pyrenophora tritici-repentis]